MLKSISNWLSNDIFLIFSDAFLILVIIIFGVVDKPCFIVPALAVPVLITILNPAVSLTLPVLSIVPIPVELASLVNDVPAFQLHEA